ncbi:hypothetical protein LA277_002722 [Vibrio parahaemolyticus]|nr:hypothetical protein [Vibrio parahaemolyticus]EJG1010551.1 hypothetical protein [Vibrio parahaemolyticus]
MLKKIKEEVKSFFKERNHNGYNLAGTTCLSIGCAYVSGYEWSTALASVDSAAKLIAFGLTSPPIGIGVGILFLIVGGTSSHYQQKDLVEENENLKKKNITLSSTQSEVKKLQGDIQRLLGDGRILKEENYRLHEKQVETWLKGLCKYIGLDSDSRVSIYYVNDGSFKLLARKSPNPLLSKFNPKVYALDKGVISLSWQKGEFKDDEIPLGEADYVQYMSDKYNYDEEHLNEIKMKSRFMLGLAIVDADENIGVILFESINNQAFNDEKIASVKKYCQDFQSYLCGFVRDCIRYERDAIRDVASRSQALQAESKKTDIELIRQLEVRK